MVDYYLIGVDGDTRIDLSDPESPIRLTVDPEGLDGPPHDPAMQENVNQGGAFYKGQQDKPNQIKLLYRFGGGIGFDSDELMEAAITWRRALGTGRELAEFHVVDDQGTDRWQWVRNSGSYGGPAPSKLRSAQYVGNGGVTLTSDSSYWESEAIDVLDPTTVSNGGDFAAWPQWEITGPTTGLKIGVDGEQIALANIPAGKVYTIDTDPTLPRIMLDGVDNWASAAGRQSFRKSVPPGETVSVTTIGSADSVRLVLPQQHWAAIG